MKYAISYSSLTGNTKYLADGLSASLPQEDCVFFGETGSDVPQAPLLYVGFWTDRGTCDDKTKQLLKCLHDKKLFLFGTAGFGMDPAYYEQILTEVRTLLDDSVEVVGSFLCPGRMPMSVRERYEHMDNLPHKQMMLENFELALKHPNEDDLDALVQTVRAAVTIQ